MFFFFESEQERRVREDVEKNMQICIENPKKYETAKEVLVMHVSSSNQKPIEQVVDHIKATIKNEDLQPVRKYQAIRLLRDLMLTHNKALGKYVLKKILKRLTIIAQHKTGTKEEADEERGRDIFGRVKRDQEEYSIKFLSTLLTALEEWGTKWPKTPDGPYKDFHREYNQLVMNGVKFPKYKIKTESVSPAARTSSVSPVNKRTSIQKNKSSQEIPKSKPKIPEQNPRLSEIKSKLKAPLEKEFQDYFDKVIESINLFSECLQSASLEQFPFLREIIAEMEKASEKGNELIVQLQGGMENSSQAKKVETIFTFLETLKKQMNVVSKKPEKFEIFQRKYLKSTKATVKILSEKEKRSVSKQQNSDISQEKPSKNQIKPEVAPPKEPERTDVPRIKNQNRYTSVSGDQVLQQFKQLKGPETGDAKAESVSSQRFGSFGGPNTERHRASFVGGSPVDEKNVRQDKSNSDRKNDSPSIPKPKQRDSRQSQPEVPQPAQKPVDAIKPQEPQKKGTVQSIKPSAPLTSQPASVEVRNPRSDQKKQNNAIPSQDVIIERKDESLNNSANFFKQFNPQPSNSISKVVENPFKGNDSFGAFGSQKNVSKDYSQDEDFFAKIENTKPANTNMIQQRRKSPKNMAPDRQIFEDNIKSQISEGLSAFDVNRPGDNSQISGNKSQNKKGQQPESKKSIEFDNPFGTEAQHPNKSRVSQINKSSNFFGELQARSGIHSGTEINVAPANEVIGFDSGHRPQNPFETGNFGKLAGEGKPKQADNPFDTESRKGSHRMQKKPSNPFMCDHSFDRDRQSQQSRNSHKSQASNNPFGTEIDNPFSQQKSNPFEQNSGSNPFETSNIRNDKDGIDEFLQIFKPPTAKVIEDLSNNHSFSNIQNTRGPVTVSPNKISSNPRESIVFTVNIQREDEPGLNFSQFADVAPTNQRNSNPFAKVSGEKSSNQINQSGFSLSNFAPVGPDPFAAPRNSDLGNTHDFFAGFQKKSKTSSMSRKSKDEHVENAGQPLKQSQNFFGQFNQQFQKGGKRSTQTVPKDVKGIVQRQKTQKSCSEKSFNFSNLDKLSHTQKEGQKNSGQVREIQFSQFGDWGRNDATSRKEVKDGLPIENASQKSLSWGDFDMNNKTGNSAQRQDKINDNADQIRSNILSVHSRTDLSKIRQHPATDRIESASKINQDQSIELNILDFAPLSKKGVAWNPLSLIPNLKPPSVTYFLDQSKLKEKRSELQLRKKQYEEKVAIFKEAKTKSNEIRSRLLQKMGKIDEIIAQKSQFQQILKQIKEANQVKEKEILEINRKIKQAEEIRAKILQKQKQLYELTKNQLHLQEKKTTTHRATSTKWELFNKNLEKNRTAVMNSRTSYGY